MSNQLQIIEYDNKRVLTTSQLAEVYETEENNIKNNFSRNKSRFTKGKDYYFLQGADLKAFKRVVTDNDEAFKFVSQLYLWTDRGANRHCKILDTDMAWQQFDILEETYFKVKNNQIQLHSYQIEDPIERAKSWIEEQKEKQLLLAKNNELEEIIEVQEPKVKAYTEFMDTKKTYSMEAVAKMLDINTGRTRLLSFLRAKGIILKDARTPIQRYRDNIHFKVFLKEINKGLSEEREYEEVTRVFPKGIDLIRQLISEASQAELYILNKNNTTN